MNLASLCFITKLDPLIGRLHSSPFVDMTPGDSPMTMIIDYDDRQGRSFAKPGTSFRMSPRISSIIARSSALPRTSCRSRTFSDVRGSTIDQRSMLRMRRISRDHVLKRNVHPVSYDIFWTRLDVRQRVASLSALVVDLICICSFDRCLDLCMRRTHFCLWSRAPTHQRASTLGLGFRLPPQIHSQIL